jgi:arginyl-tRNA synthetase
MRDSICSDIASIVARLFGAEVTVELSRPDEQFGDYATNVALKLAKQLGQNPRDVAQQIAAELERADGISSVSIAGPGFINIGLDSNVLVSWLDAAVTNAPQGVFGANTSGKGTTVVCEFPSPNMAKPFSVGHIRSALQGWAVAQVMRLNEYTVVTDNHVGDAGTPFGKWVVGYLRYSSPEQLEQQGINELARVYIAITADIKKEKEAGEHAIADEVQMWLQKLEANDAEAKAYSKRFNAISFDHMHEIMDRLGISTDYEYGESMFVVRGKELAEELLANGVAQESNGAVVVDLEDEGIDTPVMLRKANGTALYATTDLATMEFRDKKWQPNKVFIHTGQEQAFYFRQLNALARKAGRSDNIHHLWHGLVDQLDEHGNRGKMSSRKGVVLLSDLLDEAEKRAAEFAREGSEEDIRAVALAAVKFTDFMADRKKGVLFDWESMFNVQGFSGPAVQYAAVRIRSIVAKAGDADISPKEGYDWTAEHQLLMEVSEFPALIRELSENWELHKLAAYLYNLARVINRYYESTPILKSDPKMLSNRLWLLTQTERVFVTGLDILGIPVPEKM